jgi:hypothetical protein
VAHNSSVEPVSGAIHVIFGERGCAYVGSLIKVMCSGALLLCDVDQFNSVNLHVISKNNDTFLKCSCPLVGYSFYGVLECIKFKLFSDCLISYLNYDLATAKDV